MIWYLKQVLLALDQLLNTLIGGWADESFSARCYRNRFNNGWLIMMRIVNLIFFNRKHCQQAYESEKQRTQCPVEYRD